MKKYIYCFLLILAACGGGSSGQLVGVPGGTASDWLIPNNEVVDGGPGVDGIPALDKPAFELVSSNTTLNPRELIIGVQYAGETKAYPHEILNWHEIVNDGHINDPFVLSYCPLTGSAVAWKGDPTAADPTFGVSGLLYNSNLILYDRATDSRWSQMLELAVNGARSAEQPERIQVVETTWGTWQAMYPDSLVLSRVTGHQREYDIYPYGNYRTSNDLLFPVSNSDNRLHVKERVIGIRSDNDSKVYQIAGFGPSTQAINDQFDGQPIIVVGNSDLDLAVIFSRELPDGTILTFSPINDDLPNIMQDDEGNVWNVFGTAVSGPRVGEELMMTKSYTAMWFAWVAFFPNAQIHFN